MGWCQKNYRIINEYKILKLQIKIYTMKKYINIRLWWLTPWCCSCQTQPLLSTGDVQVHKLPWQHKDKKHFTAPHRNSLHEFCIHQTAGNPNPLAMSSTQGHSSIIAAPADHVQLKCLYSSVNRRLHTAAPVEENLFQSPQSVPALFQT